MREYRTVGERRWPNRPTSRLYGWPMPFRFGFRRLGARISMVSSRTHGQQRHASTSSSWATIPERESHRSRRSPSSRPSPIELGSGRWSSTTTCATLSSWRRARHAGPGRLEVGIGAGHAFTEYRTAGLRFDPPPIRKGRLQESLAILRTLLIGGTTSVQGRHYSLENARVPAPETDAGSDSRRGGRSDCPRLRSEHADIVAPTIAGVPFPTDSTTRSSGRPIDWTYVHWIRPRPRPTTSGVAVARCSLNGHSRRGGASEGTR